MSGHTPGPWSVIIDDDGNPLSGRPGVFASAELDCSIVHWDGFVQEYWRSARGDKEIHANARLIAAAPELLDAHLAWNAAEDARNDCSECCNEGPWEQCGPCSLRFGDAIDLRSAAIAKATGQ